jgi:hypothetical protein
MENSKSYRTLTVVENVRYPFAPLHMRLGDLYVTDEGIAFIAYAQFTHSGGLGYIMGGLVGGIVGGVVGGTSMNKQDKDTLESGLQLAAYERLKTCGMKIKERADSFKMSVFISSADISSLNCDEKNGKLVCINKDGTKTEFLVPDLSSYITEFVQYPSGRVRYDTATDTHGIFLSLPSAARLIGLFEGASVRAPISDEITSTIKANEHYVYALLVNLLEQKPETQKLIAAKIAELQPTLASSLYSIVDGVFSAGRSSGYISAGLLLVVIGGVFIAFLIPREEIVWNIITGVFVIGGLIMIIWQILDNRRKGQKARQLKAILKGIHG